MCLNYVAKMQPAAAERVEIAPQVQVPAVFDDPEEILRGFAEMDVDGQVPGGGELQLDAEGLLLLGLEIGPVVVVQADLADGDDAPSAPGLEGVDLAAPVLVDGARVEPQHRPQHAGMPLHEGEHPVPLARIHVCLQLDGHAGFDAARDHLVFATGEGLVIGVGVRVDEFHISHKVKQFLH